MYLSTPAMPHPPCAANFLHAIHDVHADPKGEACHGKRGVPSGVAGVPAGPSRP